MKRFQILQLLLIASTGFAADWSNSPRNPVLARGEKKSFDWASLAHPCVVKHEGRYFLYHAAGNSYVKKQLSLAISTDGVTFKKTNRALLPVPKGGQHFTPALLRQPNGELLIENGRWHLFYSTENREIEHAVSKDGLTWERDPRSPVLKNAERCSIIRVGDEYRMYYCHDPGVVNCRPQPWEIHLATGPDIYSLKPHPDNPVLERSQEWEGKRLFYPYIIRENNTWVLFYASYWSPFIREHDVAAAAIGFATSNDGVHWQKSDRNPVVTPTPGSDYEATYTSSPCVDLQHGSPAASHAI